MLPLNGVSDAQAARRSHSGYTAREEPVLASSDEGSILLPRQEVSIYVRRGPLRGQFFPMLGVNAFLVGRAPSNHIVLPDRHVSANHCLLARRRLGKGFALVDVRSRQGTRVNGLRLKKGTVNVGDVITIGPFELELVETMSAQHPPYAGRPSADRPARLELLSLEDEAQVEVLRPASATIIGRDRLAHVVVDDPFVSTFHCLICLHPEDDDRRPFVVDLHSGNGTYVNGRPIHRKHMRLSDTLIVGQTRFTLRLHELGWPTTPAPELAAPPPDRPTQVAATVALTPGMPLPVLREPAAEAVPPPMVSVCTDVDSMVAAEATPARSGDKAAESLLPASAVGSPHDGEVELAQPWVPEAAHPVPVASLEPVASEVAPHAGSAEPDWDEAFELELPCPPPSGVLELVPVSEPDVPDQAGQIEPAASEALPTLESDDGEGVAMPPLPAVAGWVRAPSGLPEPPQEAAGEWELPPERMCPETLPTARWDAEADVAAPAAEQALPAWDEAPDPAPVEPVQEAVPEAAARDPHEAAEPHPAPDLPAPRWEAVPEVAPLVEPTVSDWGQIQEPGLCESRAERASYAAPPADPPALAHEELADPDAPEPLAADRLDEGAEVVPPVGPAFAVCDETFEPMVPEPPRQSAIECFTPPGPVLVDHVEAGEPETIGVHPVPHWEAASCPVPPGEPLAPAWDEALDPVLPEPPVVEAPEALPPVGPLALAGMPPARWEEAVEPSPPTEPVAAAWDDVFDPERPQPPAREMLYPLPPLEPLTAVHEAVVEREPLVSVPAARWEMGTWSAPTPPPTAPPLPWTFGRQPPAPQPALPRWRAMEATPCVDLPAAHWEAAPEAAWPEVQTVGQQAGTRPAQLVAAIAAALDEIGTLAASIGMAELSSTLDEARRTHLPAARSDHASAREAAEPVARSAAPGSAFPRAGRERPADDSRWMQPPAG